MPPTSLTLDTKRRKDGRLMLIAAGEIDLSNVDTFTQALGSAIGDNAGSGETLTVDISAVEYLDSAALNALFTHAGHIRLIVHPILIPLLKISGLTELTAVEPAEPKPPTAERR